MRIGILCGAVLGAILAFSGRSVNGDAAQQATIDVHADQVLHTISRHLTGACIEDVNHEIYGGIYSQMIFGESFQEPPPAPEIAGFKVYGGRWTAVDGVVHITGGDGPTLVSDRAAFSDGEVGVDVRFADRRGGPAGLVVRVDQPGTGADNFAGYEVALDASAKVLRLARHRHNYEPIRDVPCEVAVGRWIPLAVKLAGSAIEIRVDAKVVLRHDDGANSLPAGAVGLRVWNCAADFRGLGVNAGKQVEPLPLKQATDVPEISGLWRPARDGTAKGQYAFDAKHPFVGARSQEIRFDSGDGRWGIENQGLNRWGMNFAKRRPYEGCVWARTEKRATLFASLESRDGSHSYADTKLEIAAGDWRRIEFVLTPSDSDPNGRFVLTLHEPGAVTLGYALLEPGEWGRFKNLPVRRDVAEGLIRQGVTVLRYGGSMVNSPNYRWKNMIGPRDRRPPYSGTWYGYSTNGWAIPDFMNFCEAAGFEYVPDFNIDESPQAMADFIDYAKAPSDTAWGRKRAADGHPAPYRLPYIELGNEERVDDHYAERFERLAAAIWAKDASVILVVGDFAYDRPIRDPMKIEGAASNINNLAGQQRILRFAKQHGREVRFDVHVDTDHPEPSNASLAGMFSFADALDKIADGAKHRAVVFEYNSGNHAMKRALANALATVAIERDGRLPIVTSANCLQPDKQNDNGWDQGLLFLDPSHVWLQPPGYLTQMLSSGYEPNVVRCDLAPAKTDLRAVATRSDDGHTLVLTVVNPGQKAIPAQIKLAGFAPTKPVAELTELSGPPDGVNTADEPNRIVPHRSTWRYEAKTDGATYTFPPHSIISMRFE